MAKVYISLKRFRSAHKTFSPPTMCQLVNNSENRVRLIQIS